MAVDKSLDALIADLEAQAAAAERAETWAEADERARIESAAVALADRLAAAVGSTVQLACAGGLSVSGRLMRVAPTWLIIDEADGRQALVVTAAVHRVGGVAGTRAPAGASGAGGDVDRRLGLGSALRAIARDRVAVRLHLISGEVVAGTVDRVGADFVELALHDAGQWRREGQLRGTTLIATGGIAAVRRDL